MVAQFEKRDKVFEFVEKIATAHVKSFYPTAVAKYANTSVEEVFPYLMNLTNSEELSLVWELRCPDLYCTQTIGYNTSTYWRRNRLP